METQTTLVWSDHGTVLNTITAIDLHFAIVVYPRHTELNDTFRLNQTFKQFFVRIFWILFNERPQTFHYFCDCLMKFRLMRVTMPYTL